MEDYAKELADDFDSSESEEELVQESEVQQPLNQSSDDTLSFEARLKQLLETNLIDSRLQAILEGSGTLGVTDFYKFSRVYPLIPDLKARIAKYSDQQDSDYAELLSFVNEENQTEEYKFLLAVNEISTLINQDIEVFHTLVKIQYKSVFPELESLVLNPVDYARIVTIIRQDLANIRQHEDKLKLLVSNEKVLVIIMAAIQQVRQQFTLDEEDLGKILSCCGILMELDAILNELSTFITEKLAKFAPNISAIIGPITTSQLLIATGSLRQLALTPSCNLPSLGVKDLSSQSKTRARYRQAGYLYHSDLIKFLPEDIVRSVLRIISGKVILAARIDLSNSKPGGEIGRGYLQEISQKIDKLLTPPEQQPDKALPIPKEQKSKKRGGKRFRKMKERTQMSELRKAQNKMEFGKEEDTVMDAFGEEIGMGMSRSGGGRIGQIKINTNTNARMTKAMASRVLKQNHNQSNNHLDDFNSILLPASTPKAIESKTNTEKWFTGLLKRKPEATEATDSKKQKLE
ncbi:Nop domain-containing protein [Suhomyces tanzawaensis NRRL Y-17324]|uniref:Nop domain-containing protein n=1 Tax=Suhomyces tanzawaensis NRRL Y-17324 TaxID=984487 RepID=A0A1E4SR40_9ASCO|nr:Nop domain-containing protein [Suhomyces tanzawaensis NRRL Y-17324]ODV81983.1 Nop domain-containing protein [Suhomyces tanzawaensis NRRL Y-17324]